MKLMPGTQARELSGNIYGLVEASMVLEVGDFITIDNLGVAVKYSFEDIGMPSGIMVDALKKGEDGWALLSGTMNAHNLARAERAKAFLATPGMRRSKEIIAK